MYDVKYDEILKIKKQMTYIISFIIKIFFEPNN